MDSAVASVTSLRHRGSGQSSSQQQVARDAAIDSFHPDGHCRLCISECWGDVIEVRPFRIVIHSQEPMEPKASGANARLMVDDVAVSELSVSYLSHQADAEGWLTVLAIEGEPIDPAYLNGLAAASAVVGETAGVYSTSAPLPESFRAKVHEMVGLLEALEQRVTGLAAAHEPLSIGQRESLHNAVAEVVADYLRRELAGFWSSLYEMLAELDLDRRALAVEYCRKRVQPFFRQAAFVERSNRKPRGYAGDFEMMNLIYRNETLGESLFAKCMQRYFLGHPNAEAVRNRAEYLATALAGAIQPRGGKPVRVLSVASGPAREIALLLERGVDLSNVEFELLDQDPEALSDAYHRIMHAARKTGGDVSVRLTEKRIKEFIKEDSEERYDFIYSAGLFDYLREDAAIAAAERMYALLRPRACLIIGNFQGFDRHKVVMELAMDWHLIYRTTEDLGRLFGHLGAMSVEAEPEGINLFARITAREE